MLREFPLNSTITKTLNCSMGATTYLPCLTQTQRGPPTAICLIGTWFIKEQYGPVATQSVRWKTCSTRRIRRNKPTSYRTRRVLLPGLALTRLRQGIRSCCGEVTETVHCLRLTRKTSRMTLPCSLWVKPMLPSRMDQSRSTCLF